MGQHATYVTLTSVYFVSFAYVLILQMQKSTIYVTNENKRQSDKVKDHKLCYNRGQCFVKTCTKE